MSACPRIPARDFVIFLDVDWEAEYQRNRQHFLIAELSRQLTGHSKILGVERPICPWTSLFRRKEKLARWLRGERGLRQAGPNLYLYTPVVFVHNIVADRLPVLTALNRSLLRALLMRVLKQMEFHTNELIAWVHHPYQSEDVGLVGEKWLVYDCYDDYITSEPNLARRHELEKRERAILAQADWVFVASEELQRAKGETSENVHLIPNGVEFEHFAQAARGDAKAVRQNGRPVLGFTGKITPRLDFQLLVRLAVNHPDWKLVMIGLQERDAKLIRNPAYQDFVAAPNVHLTGPKPYQGLPAHMQLFDVCLLPYRADDPFNVNCSPLKLYEYLATGKPIVSTDLPAVQPFDGLVRIARDVEEFERHVVAALAEQEEGLRHQRLAAAQENSWEQRARQVISLLEKQL